MAAHTKFCVQLISSLCLSDDPAFLLYKLSNMRNKKSQVTNILESSTQPLLELKFDSPLFAMAAHPSKPIVALGLANGYIFVFEYDVEKLALQSYDMKQLNKKKDKKDQQKRIWLVETVEKNANYDEVNGLKLLWRTKRHKGSVRSICFNADGTELYSVGSDTIVKKADPFSGKVSKKTAIGKRCAPTKMIKSETHPFLLIGDETGKVFVVDSASLEVKNVVEGVHEDAVNDILPMKHKSAYQFVTVGSTTLSLIDARKEAPKMTSENQEDEMLACAIVNPEDGDTIVCGMGEGMLTVWKEKKNELTDQISRIKVSKDESIDCVISTLNEDECVWCGCSNGDLFKVDTKRAKLIESRVHSFTDEVGFLDLDYEYRLISGGMDKVKLWAEDNEDDEGEEQWDDTDGSDVSSSSWEDEDKDDKKPEEEEEFTGFSDTDTNNKAEESGLEEEPEAQPKKKQKLTTKQVRNLQKHEHGIRRFDDL